MLKGLVGSQDLIYYCLLIVCFLVLSIARLDNERLHA
jgi:hypothetical protein